MLMYYRCAMTACFYIEMFKRCYYIALWSHLKQTRMATNSSCSYLAFLQLYTTGRKLNNC